MDATKLTATEIADLVDANDAAVNTVRAYCRENGYNAAALVREEEARIAAAAVGLDGYLRLPRTGSPHRLTRAVRRAVFAVIDTTTALRAIGL